MRRKYISIRKGDGSRKVIHSSRAGYGPPVLAAVRSGWSGVPTWSRHLAQKRGQGIRRAAGGLARWIAGAGKIGGGERPAVTRRSCAECDWIAGPDSSPQVRLVSCRAGGRLSVRGGGRRQRVSAGDFDELGRRKRLGDSGRSLACDPKPR
eukprot:143463-Prorocentrum_minimum.AAC.1